SVRQIGDLHPRAERQGAMRSGHAACAVVAREADRTAFRPANARLAHGPVTGCDKSTMSGTRRAMTMSERRDARAAGVRVPRIDCGNTVAARAAAPRVHVFAHRRMLGVDL